MWRTSLVDLEPLGPGLPLYFLLLRYLSCFFIFATLLALPIILFSMAGSSLDTVALATEIDAIHASFISIAAIGLPVSSADNATLIPLPSRPSLAFSRRGASVVIMSVDLAMSLLFLVFTVSLSRCIAAEARRVHRRVPQAADYAVYVTGLPTDATEEEVRGAADGCGEVVVSVRPSFPSTPLTPGVPTGRCGHTSPLYTTSMHLTGRSRHRAATYAGPVARCWRGASFEPHNRRGGPELPRLQGTHRHPLRMTTHGTSRTRMSGLSEVRHAWESASPQHEIGERAPYALSQSADIRNTENDAYRGSWVAEVTIATANGALLAQFQALVGLFQRLRTARARVLRFSTGSEFADPRRHTRASKQLEGVERSVDAINRQFGRRWRPDVVGAFVVFSESHTARAQHLSGVPGAFRCILQITKNPAAAASLTTGGFLCPRPRPSASVERSRYGSWLRQTPASEHS